MDISEKIEKRKQSDRAKYTASLRGLCDAVSGLSDGESAESLLESAGAMSRPIKLTGKWWKNDAMPLYCLEKDGGPARVLSPGKLGGLFYRDEKTGQRIRVTASEAERFEPDALSFCPPFPETAMTPMGLARFLMRALPASDYMFLVGSTILVALLGLVLPAVNEYVFQFVIPSGEKTDIPFVFTLLFGVVLSSALFSLLRAVWAARVGDKVRNLAEIGLWNRILNLPVKFFQGKDSGDLAERAMALGAVCDAVTTTIVPTFLTLVTSFVYLGQIGGFSSSLLVPVTVILLAMFGFSFAAGFFTVRTNRRQNAISMALSGFSYQLFQAVGTIKANGAEVRAYAKWAERYSGKMRIIPHFLEKFADSIQTLVFLLGTILIYRAVWNSGVEPSVFISFQVAFSFLTAAVEKVSGVVSVAAYVKPAMQMFLPFFEESPEKVTGRRRVASLEGRIEVSHLFFRYSEESGDIMKDLSFVVNPGEYVAIVGPSGCGKSTLIRLLLGFERPDRGAVYYDGMDMADLDVQSVRRRIGTVLQDGSLFAGDIYSNITLCAPEMSMDEAWEIAEQAGCAADIEDMPMGMFTMVSDGAGGISGGQKQRILIARALAMKPDILLFDEATSALDNVTQRTVMETLAEKSVTRIVIAHRLSTIMDCDRILCLDGGRVAEEGTYEELMERRGIFYDLAKYQLL